MAEEFQPIDPSTILYSTPSIPNALPPIVPFSGDQDSPIFPIHEDDWSQIEFLSASQQKSIQQMLTEYNAFEIENRTESGWKNVYLRRVEHKALLTALRPKQKLLNVLGSNEGKPPIIHSFSSVNGLVKNGFTTTIGNDVVLYGYTEGMKIRELGASLGEQPDNQSLVRAFATLNKEFGVILVDWRSQFMLTGVSPSGQIEIWRP